MAIKMSAWEDMISYLPLEFINIAGFRFSYSLLTTFLAGCFEKLL